MARTTDRDNKAQAAAEATDAFVTSPTLDRLEAAAAAAVAALDAGATGDDIYNRRTVNR